MKTEKFLVSLFMINLILAVILVYSIKNDTILNVFEDMFHSKTVSSGFLTFTPEVLKEYGFKSDTDEVKRAAMDDIFSKTTIKHSDLDRIANVPLVDRAMLIAKMYSTMGDGICLDGMSLWQKINMAKQKHGCSEDYAEIFSVLADYAGLKTRIVHNSLSYGVEIFDGRKWFFIDPYFALTFSDEDGNTLSYYQVAERMTGSKWIKFNFFGGKNHCMSGKNITNHPDYADASAFTSLYALMGDNIASIVNKEMTIPVKPKFVHMFAPYHEIKPYWIHVTVGRDSTSQLNRVVAGGLVLWILLFISADIVMPVYFIYSKLRKKSRN